MKFLVVLSCLVAIACAKPGIVAPFAYSGVVPSSFGYTYSSHVAAPVAYSAHSVVAPVAHSAVVAPVAHSAVIGPVAHSAVVAPAVHSAYVAAAPVVAHHAAVVGVEKTQYHAQDEAGQAAYGHSEAFQTHNAVQDAHGNKVGSYSYVAPDGQVIAANYVADALGYRVASNAAPVESAEIVAARSAHLAEVEAVKHRSRRSPVFTAYTSPLVYNTGHVATYHGTPVVARTGYAHQVVTAPHAYAYRYY